MKTQENDDKYLLLGSILIIIGIMITSLIIHDKNTLKAEFQEKCEEKGYKKATDAKRYSPTPYTPTTYRYECDTQIIKEVCRKELEVCAKVDKWGKCASIESYLKCEND